METRADRTNDMAHKENIEFGYVISSAKQAGVEVTDEMRARAKKLADMSHDAEDEQNRHDADTPAHRAS